MLSNGNQDRDVVGRSVDGRELVNAFRKTVGHVNGHVALIIRGGIDAHEERKTRRVRGIRRCDRAQLLDNKVRVSKDVVPGIQLLWCTIVGCVRVGELARLEMSDRHRNLKRGVRLDCAQILGRDKLRGRHVCRRCDHAHRGIVAGTRWDLLTICKRQVNGQAEIDEVVCGRQGWSLACSAVGRPVLFKVGGNDPRIQR